MAISPAVFEVSVCYALPNRCWQVTVSVAKGSNLLDAIKQSGFTQAFPDVDVHVYGAGVFGQRLPLDTGVHPTDRIEIYRPLVFDPKESRRRRAAHRARLIKKPTEPRRSRKPT